MTRPTPQEPVVKGDRGLEVGYGEAHMIDRDWT